MFILCHDDILLRDGLLELQKLDLKEEDAVFGGHQFYFQNAPMHYRPITVHECCSMTGVPMKKELFFYLFEYRALNVSGIIIPASCWSHHKHMPWDLLSYGFWAEYCLLCMPEIKIIYQTISPLVKIRLHSESEGASAKRNEPNIIYDAIFLYCHTFAAIRNENVRDKMIISIIYWLKDHPIRGLWYFIRIQWKMRKLDYYYPEAWKIYCYIFKKVLQKTIRLFARGAQ